MRFRSTTTALAAALRKQVVTANPEQPIAYPLLETHPDPAADAALQALHAKLTAILAGGE